MIKRRLRIFRRPALALLLLLSCLITAETRAQVTGTGTTGLGQTGIKIAGRVSNQKGERLESVTVNEAATQNVAISDAEGNYSINVLDRAARLTFSLVGYKSLTIPVGKKDIVDVVLADSITAMNQVIVVGFGTQKKASVVGAISTVKPEQLQLTPNRSLSNNLAGMVPGVIAV